MKFKSEKIEVLKENPFENDKLNRKDSVENLTTLLINISTPIVLSINAPWGSGKTTYVQMLHKNLISKKENSIYFNAWESDFANDPLVAFLGEMNNEFELLIGKDKGKRKSWEKAKKAGLLLVKKGIPTLIKIGTANIIDAESIIDETSKLVESFSSNLIEEYTKSKETIEHFKENIRNVLSNNSKQEKVFIFVDELDRCRPTYAIELLERIKHLLDIDGLVFILSMDKDQLSHSVKSLYGTNFDAIGYLRRFIDLEYNLQNPTLDDFINFQFQLFEWDVFFDKRLNYKNLKNDHDQLYETVTFLALRKQMSLREVEQFMAKINLVILSTDESVFLYPPLLAFLIFTREYYKKIYLNYIDEFAKPDEMISCLYSLIQENQKSESRECLLIECFLIAAKMHSHKELCDDIILGHKASEAGASYSPKQKEYSRRVLEIIEDPLGSRKRIDLRSIVNRIELLENFIFANDES